MSDLDEQIVIEELIAAITDAEKIDPAHSNIFLHDHISTTAIQELVAHESDAWRLQFETENHVVEVTGNNIILVDGQQAREFV